MHAIKNFKIRKDRASHSCDHTVAIEVVRKEVQITHGPKAPAARQEKTYSFGEFIMILVCALLIFMPYLIGLGQLMGEAESATGAMLRLITFVICPVAAVLYFFSKSD